MLAFALKRGGEDQWVFGIGIAAGGIGGFAGTFVAPRLRKWSLDEERLIVAALLVPGVVTAIGLLSSNALATVVMALTIGAGASVASRAVESLFGRMVPDVARGRVVARSELQFQIAQILGSTFPVLAAPGTRPGFAFLALALLVGGGLYAWRARVSVRHEAGRVLLGDEAPAIHLSLPSALVRESERLHGPRRLPHGRGGGRRERARARPSGRRRRASTPSGSRWPRSCTGCCATTTCRCERRPPWSWPRPGRRSRPPRSTRPARGPTPSAWPWRRPSSPWSATITVGPAETGDQPIGPDGPLGPDGDGPAARSGGDQPPVVTDVVTGAGCPSTSQDSPASRTTNRSDA